MELAIKGHPARGKEVIEILGILGGSNVFGYFGNNPLVVYYIDEKENYINCSKAKKICDCIIFTLEEFLEKYPYKVGDKVQHKGATSCGSVYEVEKMRWEENTVKYTLRLFGCNYKTSTLSAEYLQPYKEEAMDKVNKAIFDTNAQCCDISNHLIKEETMEEKLCIGLFPVSNGRKEIIPCDGYEVVSDEGKFYVVKKQPQYPNTYEDCCKILGYTQIYRGTLLSTFQQILICRDAYWEKVGVQPWRPDWDTSEVKFTIVECAGKVVKTSDMCNKRILAFPTEEMRDAFFDNFKDLIEQCNELL